DRVALGLVGVELHGPPQLRIGTSVTDLPDQWLARLNAYRAAAGLPSVVEDPTFSANAAKHVQYMLLNPNEFKHDETPGLPGFTPEGQQAAKTGNLYMAWPPPVAASRAIDGWMESVNHRLGMLRRELTRSGFAGACDDRRCAL